MVALPEGKMTEPRGGRGWSLSSIARAIGLKGAFSRLLGDRLERLFRVRSSPLGRRIVTFNLVALCVLLVGMLYLDQFRGGLVVEKQSSMIVESALYADALEARLAADVPVERAREADLPVSEGMTLWVLDGAGRVIASASGPLPAGVDEPGIFERVLEFLSAIPRVFSMSRPAGTPTAEALAQDLGGLALEGSELIRRATLRDGSTVLAVARPLKVDGEIGGAVVLASTPGYIDFLLRSEQKTMLQLFLLAVGVSVALSLVLASTIANPIADLARAMEAGATREGRREPQRVRIPDLTGRPDEIGRLSRAMRDMTSALYERIDANEEFAADVAHEIKNPLASLRSAVETLRIAPEGEGRKRLLDVIEHDVRRLDRLVSDISNASRLDAELVKEQEEEFDLTRMLERIAEFHKPLASDKGIELIWDAPPEPIRFTGLEERLAQVFVNLVSNAISFCGDGDAVRIWARQKNDRVLVVVEDTGPGIPDEALTKIFKRFYSERPADDYGNNSGLGLSISKQIVEAHKGVIWAENIRPDDASPGSPPLGARFVVGLPVV